MVVERVGRAGLPVTDVVGEAVGVRSDLRLVHQALPVLVLAKSTAIGKLTTFDPEPELAIPTLGGFPVGPFAPAIRVAVHDRPVVELVFGVPHGAEGAQEGREEK